MPLPLLPGLKAGAPAPTDDAAAIPASALSDFINGLDDSQVQELVAAADEWAAANPDDGAPLEEAPLEEEGAPGDTIPAPGPEDEPLTDVDNEAPAEEGDVEPSVEDLAAVSAQAEADAGDAASSIASLQDMADGDSLQAPTIGKLVAIAIKLEQALQKSQALVDKSVTKEDVQAAAQAGIDCRQYLEAIQALQQAAQTMSSATEAPAMTPKDHPALKAWAARTQGKTLAPAL